MNFKTIAKKFQEKQFDWTMISGLVFISCLVASVAAFQMMNRKSTSTSIKSETMPAPTMVRSPETSPNVVKLKPSYTLGVVAFAEKNVVMTENEKQGVEAFAKDPATVSAKKIHLKGFAGESGVAYQSRKEMALARAFAVKTILTNDSGVEARKIRVLFKASDLNQAPSVKMTAFETMEEANKDAALFISPRKGVVESVAAVAKEKTPTE
jgi:hypothetical protein